MHPIDNRAHHLESDDDIVATEYGSSDDSDHGHDDRIRPKMFEIKPKRAKLPKQIKMKSSKKRGGSRQRHHSPYESDSDDSFERVYRRTQSNSKGRKSRSRHRSRLTFARGDESSDDSFVLAGRYLGGKHRGRR